MRQFIRIERNVVPDDKVYVYKLHYKKEGVDGNNFIRTRSLRMAVACFFISQEQLTSIDGIVVSSILARDL